MTSVFERNPKKTIVIITLLILFVMDFCVSNIYFKIKVIQERTDLGIPNKYYHHDFLKNGISHESGRLGDYTIYTNSLGFKDGSNRKISRNTDKKRIVFIGDSFTEGILLNYEDTFVGVIDSVLATQDIEVLNAARVSYSPIIYWRKIKYLIEETKLKFNELVVFIDISDLDDEASYYELTDDEKVIYQEGKLNKEKTNPRDYGISWLISSQNIENIRLFLRKNLIVTSFVINLIHDQLFDDTLKLQSQNNENSINELADSVDTPNEKNTWDNVFTDRRANWTFDDKYYQEYGEKGIARMLKYMDKLLALTKEHNIGLTVVVYPWPSQIWYEDLNSLHVKIWKGWCNKNNINIIDLFPSFIKTNISEEQKLKIISTYYVPYDLHLNKKGNKLIADEFLKLYFPKLN